MPRFLIGLCLACLTLAGHAASFIIGVPPIHSMRTLAERFEPLRAYMEAQLGQPVLLESAANFADYQARTIRGAFDLAITPAHFARLAEKDQQFLPVIQFRPDHDALLVYHASHPLDDVARLKGQRLAVIDRLAVTVMASLHYLDGRGLEAGRDYQVLEYRNHASVARALETGLAMAGVTTTQGLKQMPESVRGKLVVHAHIADIPAFVILLKPGVTRAEADRMTAWLLRFADSKAGRDFLQGIAYTGLAAAREVALKRADVYLKETRKGLTP